jgi:hypothetical protein
VDESDGGFREDVCTSRPIPLVCFGCQKSRVQGDMISDISPVKSVGNKRKHADAVEGDFGIAAFVCLNQYVSGTRNFQSANL